MSSIRSTGRAFYAGLFEALLSVMGSSNGYLADHGPRTAYLARQMARAMGCSDREIAEIVLAGILGDVGLIGLAEDAWEVPTPVLDARTRGLVRAHPIRSEATLISIPHMEDVADLVRNHHEWWTGAGYPDGLAGPQIPRGARILRLADTVAALGEERPQRPPRSSTEIRAIVADASGREFSPDVARVWLDLHDSGSISEFQSGIFQKWSWQAAEELIPDAVSPISSEHLLEILASIIDAKDTYTAGHSRRVANFSVAIANQLQLSDEIRGTIWAAGYLHDLGKLSVPVRVLAKPGRLSDEELALVRGHASRGAEVLEGIQPLRHLTTGARYHHERWNGTGYPEGLSGDQIPLVPRVLAVADAYDAMTSGRAYRQSRAHQNAIDELIDQSGEDFAPEVVKAFVTLPETVFESVRSESARPDRPRSVSALQSPSPLS